jgi:restriction system protein
MARRRRKKEDPVTQLVSMLVLGALALGYYLSKSMTVAAIMAGVVIGIYLSVIYLVREQQRSKLLRSGIADIDKMDGIQFERYLSALFRSQGYQSEVTKAAGDFGADLILRKDGRKIAVQAKRYSSGVGISAVQEVQASLAHYAATEAWVVTNNKFTKAAEELAASNNVKLIGRETLIEMILKTQGQGSAAVPTPKQVMAETPSERKCKVCGNTMVLRKGKDNEFWGCASFPRCRNTQAI